MAPVISFQNVSKRYRKNVALNDVSFEVPSGCVFALLGDNGAGKTTAIKSMLGLVRIEKGEISVLGLNSRKQDLEVRRKVGFVPEQPELYDWMKVDEIGWFAAGFHDEKYFPEYRRLIEEYDVPLDQKISALSKGMRAKVSLALALAHNPDLLILDEPTSGLDPLVRREFLESMVDRAASGKTVFLSSHQISEVERVADYVALMRQSELLLVAKLDDLKNDTTELIITVTEEGVPLPLGEHFDQAILISKDRSGRQWRAMVRNISDDDLIAINASDFVDSAETRRPSLEEIFVAYLGDTRITETDNDQPVAEPSETPS